MGCDESAVHALLGHLYEQSGEKSAARKHFQLALTVAPSQSSEQNSPFEPEVSVVQQTRNAWLMVVLIGCVIFSGVGVLFTLLPGPHNVERGQIFQQSLLKPTEHPKIEPRWTWKVPSPVRHDTPEPAPDVPEPPAPSKAVLAVDQHIETPRIQPAPQPDDAPSPMQVLGPSASAGMPAEATEPTIELADQAYFHGKYERAVTIYEEVLRRQEKADPRILQNLAWCYQQLGNSEKAADDLATAIAGYQAQFAEDPHNIAAQQGCRSCEAALRSLQASHETVPAPK